MSAGLVCVTRLRPQREVQVVLVHGLFANRAFWLPELQRLEAFQLTLVGIDYARLLEQDVPLDEVAGQVRERIGPAPAHLVCHSFGCWIGAELAHPFRSRAFICPTFMATAIDPAAFCAAIGARIGIDPAAAAPLVTRAIGYKASVRQAPVLLPADELYLPEDDPFFRYGAAPGSAGSVSRYRGGHFDVAAPVAAIAQRLAGAC